MRKTFEIMFDDLNEEAQKRFLSLFGLERAEDGNWNIVPLAVFETEDGDDEEAQGYYEPTVPEIACLQFEEVQR